jgi:hypothetical protein
MPVTRASRRSRSTSVNSGTSGLRDRALACAGHRRKGGSRHPDDLSPARDTRWVAHPLVHESLLRPPLFPSRESRSTERSPGQAYALHYPCVVARDESGPLSDLPATHGSRHRQPARGNGGGANSWLVVLAHCGSELRIERAAAECWSEAAARATDCHARGRLSLSQGRQVRAEKMPTAPTTSTCVEATTP